MPYILADRRKKYDPIIELLLKEFNFLESGDLVWGDLNYVISVVIKELADRPLSYKRINAIVGVLECVKQEFYRKIASPYEDLKCDENGNI